MTKKEKRKIVKATRDKIKTLNNKRDKIYERACKKLEIQPFDEADGYLFDYCYNNVFKLDKVMKIVCDNKS